MRSFSVRLRLAALTTAAALIAGCSDDKTTAPSTPELFKTVVVFGASLDDVGNTCNLSPVACPPAPYFNGRVSNGPVWIELVAQQLGAPLTPSRTGGTNYAHSGARTGPIAGTTQNVPNMLAQVDAFVASGATANRDRMLFVLNGGTVGNDITDAVGLIATNPNAVQIPVQAVTNLSTMITKLYAAGARHILVANASDIGRTPLIRGFGTTASQLATQASVTFNASVAAQLASLRTANAGLNLYLFDVGALTTEVFANPSSFGFNNTTAPCVAGTTVCSTPDTYLYWDPFHPTAATGRLMAQRALRALGR